MDGVEVKGAPPTTRAFLTRHGAPQHSVQAAPTHSQATVLNTEWACIRLPTSVLAGVQHPAGFFPVP